MIHELRTYPVHPGQATLAEASPHIQAQASKILIPASHSPIR